MKQNSVSTTTQQSRDLTNMSLVTLFGKLQEHEMELMRLHQYEKNDKKKKGIALKASSSSIHEENDKEDSNEKNLEEDDDFRLFVKRFNKFMRNKGNRRRSKEKRRRFLLDQFQNAMNAINLDT